MAKAKDEFPDWLIEEYRERDEVRKALNSRTPDGMDLTAAEIIAYIKLEKKRQGKSERLESQGEIFAPTITIQEEDFERLYKEYSEYYAISTPNDAASIRQLIKHQLIIEAIDSFVSKYLGSIDPNVIKMLDGLNKERASRQQNFVSLQQELAMTRKQQLARDDKSEKDQVLEIIDQSAEFFDKEVVSVVCPKCFTGDTWAHLVFRDTYWGLIYQCGCGARLMVCHNNEKPHLIDDNAWEMFLEMLVEMGANEKKLREVYKEYIP